MTNWFLVWTGRLKRVQDFLSSSLVSETVIPHGSAGYVASSMRGSSHDIDAPRTD